MFSRLQWGFASLTGLSLYNMGLRLADDVSQGDDFSKHTSNQHQKHPFSGMHEPYIPTHSQQEFFENHFPEHSHLLPKSFEAFQRQNSLETAVKIVSLQKCPQKIPFKNAGTVVVGGPPALISSANCRNITYIYNSEKSPIAYGSAWHLEWDAESEAPTTYRPSWFMLKQITRAIFSYSSLYQAEKTGHFPWRALDWTGWLMHPKCWAEGLRIALAFQKLTTSYTDPDKRGAVLKEVADRTKANEKFYIELNRKLGGKLLSVARGSIIVARNKEEEKELHSLKSGLAKENRELKLLSNEEMKKRFGFIPAVGVAFGEKTHDRILSTHFLFLLAKRVNELGGKILEGKVTTIYVDSPSDGGVVEMTTSEGKHTFIPFSKLVMSLGDQRIYDKEGRTLFDIVTARGVSILAVAYVPEGRTLPQAIVCGETNHAIKLSDAVKLKGSDGNFYDGYLLRMTAGACITPTVSDKKSANYDATVAVGLVTAVRQTLDCYVEPFAVYGCNRQVSEHGQSHWISPFPTSPKKPFAPRGQNLALGSYLPQNERGVFIQMGAGGGGLTQGPSQPPLL